MRCLRSNSALALSVSIAAALALAVGGCSSGNDSSDSGAAPTAVAAKDSGGSYCDLYASYVAKGVENYNNAMSMDMTDPNQVAQQQEIAKQVQANAEVSVPQLEAAAPPDQRALYDKLEAINDKARQDPMADVDDGIIEIPKQLNAWAKAHCPAKYQPIFSAYDKVIN
ncbi:hypothetical protein [Gordonia sp. CPCC 205515]|uniref:hypothetical protein n=1 Tax=Gordonia sp. CPCC 205515 TaxID=3140791 RepID=UPI003AF3A233